MKATIKVAKQLAADETVLDFVENYDTYTSSGWSNSYAAHELTFEQLGESTVDGKVKLDKASKQGADQVIHDRPVIAARAGDSYYPTVYVTVELTSKTISSISFTLKDWSSSKKFSDIHIEYLTGTDTWTKCSADWGDSKAITTGGQTIESTTIPAGVKTVRLVITTTATSNQQIGLTSITIKTADAATVSAPAQVAILPGKEF